MMGLKTVENIDKADAEATKARAVKAAAVNTPIRRGEDIWIPPSDSDSPPPPPPPAPPAPPALKIEITRESPKDGEDSKLSANNQKKLDAAIAHLKKLFADAAGPQIGERPFYGRVAVEAHWQKGECLELRTNTACGDRVDLRGGHGA
jgi:hypothetical protein